MRFICLHKYSSPRTLSSDPSHSSPSRPLLPRLLPPPPPPSLPHFSHCPSFLLLLPLRMPKAGVAGQDASAGPAWLARAPTSPKRPKQPPWGPGVPWWLKRRGRESQSGSGVIYRKDVRGGPQYSAYMHPSVIGLAAECRDTPRSG